MDRYISEKSGKGMRNVPSLLELCIWKAIDNVRYLGDVGGIVDQFLEQILPHCTAEQLMHIEDSTKGRDLTPMTDNLWKKFYEKKFGERSYNSAVNYMSTQKTYKWRKLYEGKLKEVEAAQQKSIERMKQLYRKEDAQKKSRQVKLCTKVPPSTHKRNCYGGWGPGSIVGSSKSSLMKKSKLDFLKYNQEVKNLTALRKNAVQKNDRPGCIRKPGSFLSEGSTSTSQASKPFQRR